MTGLININSFNNCCKKTKTECHDPRGDIPISFEGKMIFPFSLEGGENVVDFNNVTDSFLPHEKNHVSTFSCENFEQTNLPCDEKNQNVEEKINENTLTTQNVEEKINENTLTKQIGEEKINENKLLSALTKQIGELMITVSQFLDKK